MIAGTHVRRMLVSVVGMALGLLITAGCQYHFGSLMHPQISTITVGDFLNETTQPGLSVALRNKLAEQVMRDGSVGLVDMDAADSVLQGKIVSIKLDQIASVKARDENVRDDDQDKYQSAIYRVEVVVSYELKVPGYRTPLISPQTATGTADFSRLPDMYISKQEAIQTALTDVAGRIVASVTEAW